MPQDKSQRSELEIQRAVSRDLQRIDLSLGYEVRYWCQAFRCTEPQLRWAISEIGPIVGDVRRYLSSSPYLVN
jgi:hypothetical protein